MRVGENLDSGMTSLKYHSIADLIFCHPILCQSLRLRLRQVMQYILKFVCAISLDFENRICFLNKNLITINIVMSAIAKMTLFIFLLFYFAKSETLYANGKIIYSFCYDDISATYRVRVVSTNY